MDSASIVAGSLTVQVVLFELQIGSESHSGCVSSTYLLRHPKMLSNKVKIKRPLMLMKRKRGRR